MSGTTFTLPEGYSVIMELDLQKDKKLALRLNIGALLILIAVAGLSFLLQPLSILFDGGRHYFIILCVLMLLYIPLHELVHGVFIRIFSGRRPGYGFTGAFACAGSEAYFCKKHYITIALSPIVFWGIVFALPCLFIRGPWFSVFALLEAYNLSGAVGDIYVTWRFSKLPPDILIQDPGLKMTVYGK